MKAGTVISSALALIAAACHCQAQAYKIELQSNGKEVAVVRLSIDRDSAIATVADMTERFDLKDQRWQHDETKQWVTLLQCETWAKQSKEKTTSSIASVPEQVRTFVNWSLDPKYQITAIDDVLLLTSGQVDYKVVVQKSDRDLASYYRYARLNAYKKAMVERKLPPFAELAVLEELERRELMPKSMDIQIPGIPGSSSIKMLISMEAEAAKGR